MGVKEPKRIIIIIIIIIIKTSCTDPRGKNKVVYKLLSQPYMHLRRGKRKHNPGKQSTVDCILEPIQRSGVKHSVKKFIPHSNLNRQERPSKFSKLRRSDTSNSSGLAAAGDVEL